MRRAIRETEFIREDLGADVIGVVAPCEPLPKRLALYMRRGGAAFGCSLLFARGDTLDMARAELAAAGYACDEAGAVRHRT